MRQLLLGFVLGLTTATAAQPTPGGYQPPKGGLVGGEGLPEPSFAEALSFKLQLLAKVARSATSHVGESTSHRPSPD